MYSLYRQWFAFRPLEGSHLDRLVNANRFDRQQKKQDYSHTSEIGKWAAEWRHLFLGWLPRIPLFAGKKQDFHVM
jgi:hypothetical protein